MDYTRINIAVAGEGDETHASHPKYSHQLRAQGVAQRLACEVSARVLALPQRAAHLCLTAVAPCTIISQAYSLASAHGDGRAHVRFNIRRKSGTPAWNQGPGTLGPSLFNRCGDLRHNWQSCSSLHPINPDADRVDSSLH